MRWLLNPSVILPLLGFLILAFYAYVMGYTMSQALLTTANPLAAPSESEPDR